MYDYDIAHGQLTTYDVWQNVQLFVLIFSPSIHYDVESNQTEY